MTRKHFIKLLMSKGFSRNEAQHKADYYNSRNIPYERAYSFCRVSCAMKGVSKAAIKAAKSIGAFVGTIKFISRGDTE